MICELLGDLQCSEGTRCSDEAGGNHILFLAGDAHTHIQSLIYAVYDIKTCMNCQF